MSHILLKSATQPLPLIMRCEDADGEAGTSGSPQLSRVPSSGLPIVGSARRRQVSMRALLSAFAPPPMNGREPFSVDARTITGLDRRLFTRFDILYRSHGRRRERRPPYWSGTGCDCSQCDLALCPLRESPDEWMPPHIRLT